jgi:hypothetical protein
MHGAARPSREVIQSDAIAWLEANHAPLGASVVTSLPDVSEMEAPRMDLETWRAWFVQTVARVVRWVPEKNVAIFYQSDIRHEGAWIDKGHLVMRGAEDARAVILWHKIVCRKPPGTISRGRPSYSHMICATRAPSRAIGNPGPDVIADAGFMSWSRAMGVNACRVAVRFLAEEIRANVIVDPFCGRGTVLAVANEMGLDAIGIDLSRKRCRAARSFTLEA